MKQKHRVRPYAFPPWMTDNNEKALDGSTGSYIPSNKGTVPIKIKSASY
ncbi:hypothetical protein SAMD00020551_3257 [Mesobacillus selenatarsenatis SF-1]|uniref:Uncharacterized protein n=1 Tax=Mesobacillus selenatarsenatis (strain DSM 18680 / JCM 14380 / FERM P-15431 / SF-1) TaxID=1321606 RepID=A0A0A8XA98_MESS1|nr:hypothetical protein SAMD00020551_3257 [Mesobacillus selenatarsenatis SF-1]